MWPGFVGGFRRNGIGRRVGMGLKQKLDCNSAKNKEIVGEMKTLGMPGRMDWTGAQPC